MRTVVLLAFFLASCDGDPQPIEETAAPEPGEIEPETTETDPATAENEAEVQAASPAALTIESPGSCSVAHEVTLDGYSRLQHVALGHSPGGYLLVYASDEAHIQVHHFDHAGGAIGEPSSLPFERPHLVAHAIGVEDRWLVASTGTCRRDRTWCTWVRVLDDSGAPVGDVQEFQQRMSWTTHAVARRRVFAAVSRSGVVGAHVVRADVGDDGIVILAPLAGPEWHLWRHGRIRHIVSDGERVAVWALARGYGTLYPEHMLWTSEQGGDAVEIPGLRGVVVEQIAFVNDAIRMTYTREGHPPRTIIFDYDGSRQGESQAVQTRLGSPNPVRFERTATGVRRIDAASQPVGVDVEIDWSNAAETHVVGDLARGAGVSWRRDGSRTSIRVVFVTCAP